MQVRLFAVATYIPVLYLRARLGAFPMSGVTRIATNVRLGLKLKFHSFRNTKLFYLTKMFWQNKLECLS